MPRFCLYLPLFIRERIPVPRWWSLTYRDPGPHSSSRHLVLIMYLWCLPSDQLCHFRQSYTVRGVTRLALLPISLSACTTSVICLGYFNIIYALFHVRFFLTTVIPDISSSIFFIVLEYFLIFFFAYNSDYTHLCAYT